MTQAKVLVVDDESDICELISLTLSRMQVDAVSAHDIASAQSALKQQAFSLCLTDMRLPDGDGVDLVAWINKYTPDVPVAVITAYGNVEGAVNSLKAGAFDYVSKPVDLTQLRRLVNTAIKCSNSGKKATQANSVSDYQLLGNSPAIQDINHMINKVARSQAPVHIEGDSGTGKECVARLIHAKGPRADQAFIPVNCGALPPALLESEFFGYKKGAFTGAQKDSDGLFQAANGGTLFLDEVAELPLDMQVKLLRAIQERAVRPVGSQEEVTVDVRILSATHQDLAEMVRRGQFRQDLYYRINVIGLRLPSLLDRNEDIALLANHFLAKLNASEINRHYQLSDAALEALKHYSFPGNVRELENIIERAVALCETDIIEVEDCQLPDVPLTQQMANTNMNLCDIDTMTDDLPAMLDQIEKETIMRALERNQWNKTKTAEALGISFRALRYRLKKLELEE